MIRQTVFHGLILMACSFVAAADTAFDAPGNSGSLGGAFQPADRPPAVADAGDRIA